MDKIWTDAVKEDYFVYDYINGMERPDVIRVEVPKDNQLLRLRIEGCDGSSNEINMKGIYLQITKYN